MGLGLGDGAVSGAAFLRVKKLKGSGIIAVAARHNRRDRKEEKEASGSIDPARSHLNYNLVGPPTVNDVAQLAKDLMTAAGVDKPRKNAVLGIEIVFSLPVNHRLDDRAYFTDCVAWAGAYFGGAGNVLSADVHHDEGAPHCHVLALPLLHGHMNGGRIVGGRAKLMAMQSQFHEVVATKYGLRKAPARMSGARKHAAAALVLARLRKVDDPALRSEAWATIRDTIEREPEPWLNALGLEMETIKKPVKEFVQFVTSKGKGPKYESVRPTSKSIDFVPIEGEPKSIDFTEQGFGKEQSLCSVDLAQNTAPIDFANPGQAEPPLPVSSAYQLASLDGAEHPDPASAPHHSDHQQDAKGTPPGSAGVGFGHRANASSASTAVPRVKAGLIRMAHEIDGQDIDSDNMSDDAINYEQGMPKELTRERDSDYQAEQWSEALGEFVSAPQPFRVARQAAEAWVAAGLATLAARNTSVDELGFSDIQNLETFDETQV